MQIRKCQDQTHPCAKTKTGDPSSPSIKNTATGRHFAKSNWKFRNSHRPFLNDDTGRRVEKYKIHDIVSVHSIVRCQQKLWENPSPKVSDFVSRIRKLFVQPFLNMTFRFQENRTTDSKPDRRKTARKVAAAALSIGMKWNQFRRTFCPTKSKIYDVGDGSVLA